MSKFILFFFFFHRLFQPLGGTDAGGPEHCGGVENRSFNLALFKNLSNTHTWFQKDI